MLFALIGAFSGGNSDTSNSSDNAGSAAPATTTTAAKVKPAAKPKPKPESAKPRDTGRMSEGEFSLFKQAQAKLVEESIQFSDRMQRCSVIGASGDFAGFGECVDDAYSGFEDKASYAVYIADDTLDNVAKQCQAALRSYRTVASDYAGTVAQAYDVASRLDFAAFEAAFNELPKAVQRWSRFSTNALKACEPR